MTNTRTLQLQRGVIDLETGEFPLILASNGEASDGHIIDVAGMDVDERIPMFANHNADPMQRMGGLIKPVVTGKTTQKGRGFLRMVGVIDMAGDGALPDIRRDVAQGIHLGDLTQMSLRWDDLEPPVARSSLPTKHFAFSEAGSESWNTPMFFSKTKAREGSIVGLAADQAALIGRSRDLSKPSHVREFYEVLARGGDPAELVDDLCAVCAARDLDTRDVELLQEQMTRDLIEATAARMDAETIANSDTERPEDAREEEHPEPQPPALEPDGRELSEILNAGSVLESTLTMIAEIQREASNETMRRAAAKIRDFDYAKLGAIK